MDKLKQAKLNNTENKLYLLGDKADKKFPQIIPLDGESSCINSL